MAIQLSDFAPLEHCAFVHDSVPAAEVLHVFGDVDITDDGNFEAAIERSIRDGRPLVIDLAGCAYMGASALSVLVRAKARLGDALRLAAPATGFAGRLLTIAEMQRYFTIERSLESALSSLHAA
jgi:anti-anti-sigma factor